MRFGGNVAVARALRRRMTASEIVVWRWLRGRRFSGWKFRRQHPIGPFVVDFFCDALKVAVEIDGASHSTDAAAFHDSRRTAYLQRIGIYVLRLQARDVMRHRDLVLETLRVELEQRAALTRRFAAPSAAGRG
jgi:very-short-patch-repair endonuclease